MIISSLKKKSINKYEVIIDEKKHIILGDVLLKYNILKPCKIDNSIYEKIISDSEIYEYYNKMILFISKKLRTEKEIRNKLKIYKINNSNINTIIDMLKNNNYLDSQKYIYSYINDNINLTLNGPIKIKNNLLKGGFNEMEIDNYLNKFNDIWFQRINTIINKKIKIKKDVSLKMFKIKIRSDLINLGYPDYLINNIIDDIYFSEENAYQNIKNKYLKTYSKKYKDDILEYKIKQKMYSLGFEKN